MKIITTSKLQVNFEGKTNILESFIFHEALSTVFKKGLEDSKLLQILLENEHVKCGEKKLGQNQLRMLIQSFK